MTKEEYIEGKLSAGHFIHQHDGIWWEKTRKGYCKTAILYEAISAGKRPSLSNSFVGFNHRTFEKKAASGFWEPYLLKEEEIENWSIENLKSSSRRSSIRKGLRSNNVKQIENIIGFRESFSSVLKSTSERTKHGFPPGYYDLEKDEWWLLISKVANYTEFWGAFQGDTLTGYVCIHVAGDRVIVDAVKSDTKYLSTNPIDAIMYTIMTDLKQRGIREIWYGGKSNRQGLDRFKESYGFQLVEIPFNMYLIGGLLKYPRFLDKYRKKG